MRKLPRHPRVYMLKSVCVLLAIETASVVATLLLLLSEASVWWHIEAVISFLFVLVLNVNTLRISLRTARTLQTIRDRTWERNQYYYEDL